MLFEALQYYVHLILTAFMLPRWFEQRMRLHPSPVPVSHSYEVFVFFFTNEQIYRFRVYAVGPVFQMSVRALSSTAGKVTIKS